MKEIFVGTPEWDELTSRRAALIQKKIRGGLDPAEAVEFERLQELSRGIIEKAFPLPPKAVELGEFLDKFERRKP